MHSYCKACLSGELSDLHVDYHAKVYGFPAASDDELFGRMILEISQAGLSWDTILKKKDSIREAHDDFHIERVAKYKEKDILRLLQNPGIIRMRRKIEAVISNAQVIRTLSDQEGSFMEWMNSQGPFSLDEWRKLFKKTFRFMGNEITKEFVHGTGFHKGAHSEDCPIYAVTIALNPPWQNWE